MRIDMRIALDGIVRDMSVEVAMASFIAEKFHKGQYRKKLDPSGNKIEYITHPKSVVSIIEGYGGDYATDSSKILGWLHDTVEDTNLSYDTIENIFGSEIRDGVYILTRNVGRDEYKERIKNASREVQIVKLADTYHNMDTMSGLDQSLIERKINDSIDTYIPLAKKVSPIIAAQMNKIVKQYI